MLIYYIALFDDMSQQAKDDEEKERFENLLAILTPIAKAFMTETGFESVNLGLQIFGGHGYIQEWGMEQNVRDSRISMLYEGTTGIQSLDLLGRKVIMTGGKLLQDLISPISEFCDNTTDEEMAEFINPLKTLLAEWQTLTEQIGVSAMSNPEEINAACVDYLMYSGYVLYAFLFARSAKISKAKLATGTTEQEFYDAKVYLARFYFQRLLPRTASLTLTMTSGVENLLDDAVNPF